MARPKNEIPTELLAARVPASLVKRLHEEADRVGVRLGKYLTRALEEAVEEGYDDPDRELPGDGVEGPLLLGIELQGYLNDLWECPEKYWKDKRTSKIPASAQLSLAEMFVKQWIKEFREEEAEEEKRRDRKKAKGGTT
jgi:hypothetical protein